MGTPTNASTQQKAAESDKAVKLADKVLAKAEQKKADKKRKEKGKSKAKSPEAVHVPSSDDDDDGTTSAADVPKLTLTTSPSKTAADTHTAVKKASKDGLTAVEIHKLLENAFQTFAARKDEDSDDESDAASFELPPGDAQKLLADVATTALSVPPEGQVNSDSPILAAFASQSTAITTILSEGTSAGMHLFKSSLTILKSINTALASADGKGKGGGLSPKELSSLKKEHSTLVHALLGVLKSVSETFDETVGATANILQAEILARGQAAKANNALMLAGSLHLTGMNASMAAPVLAVMQQNSRMTRLDDDSRVITKFWNLPAKES